MRAVVGDSCLGIVHSEKAGTASADVQPRMTGFFLDDNAVQMAVEAYVEERAAQQLSNTRTAPPAR